MYKRFVGLLICLVMITGFVQAQSSPASVKLSIEAGFDGTFREFNWLPLYIRATNDGEGVDGRLVVRPETSTSSVRDTYSLPISLPTGSIKSVFLYITAESFASEIRVEFIANDGSVLTAEPTRLRSVQPRDQIHVVVTDSANGAIDLSSVHDGGYTAFQTNWRIENIPDRAVALNAVDTMVFSDVDSGTLTTRQQEAITDWVAQGGHLIVTGGVGWQSTAAGFTNLLPIQPDNSTTVDNLTPMADWLRFGGDPLNAQTVVATGSLQTGSRIITTASDDMPLIARRMFGAGTVDYITAAPSALPLRDWGGMGEMWLTLATSVNPIPSWSYGVADWNQIASAINILPGVNLLPDILPLCGFLALYIALIGPLNYMVLNKINRREYAWVTIPIFIVLFSALAWVYGFNLRGSEVTLSRLSIVQSWSDSERATVQQVIGLLSPRRTQYSLNTTSDSFLRTLPSSGIQASLLGNSILSSTTIEQTDVFRAVDFPVDASFIAGFDSETSITKPAVTGQVTLISNGNGMQTMRGSVRNDSDQTLTNAIILVRGQSFVIEQPIAPGDLVPFELTLPGEGLPSPSPIAYTSGGYTSYNSRIYNYYTNTSQSVEDILGGQISVLTNNYTFRNLNGTPEQEEFLRRSLFLSGLIDEPYKRLTGRGNHAYLAAWTNQAPLETSVIGGNVKTLDSTLLLIQLDVQATHPSGETLISADQFTWFAPSRNSLADIGPLDIALNPGDETVLRFTPLPDAILSAVNELRVYVDRNLNTSRNVGLELWNWETESWVEQTTNSSNQIILSDPAAFIGPENAVQIRIASDAFGGYPRLSDLSIEQLGVY